MTRIPLRCVPKEHISFTEGDSMATLERNGAFTLRTKDDLAAMMAAHPGGATGYLEDAVQRYNYIEVQLWDDSPCLFAEQVR